MTDETYGRILLTMPAPQVGGLSEESTSYIMDFSVEHSHILELARSGTFDQSAISGEEFVEIVEDGPRLHGCMAA